MHVALFGGSFNPPHVGHQLAALYVLETAPVDALWLVPCFAHAFDKVLAPFAQRVRMCEAMAAALGSRVRVETIEGTRGGPSRTLYTVQALQAAYPEHKFSLIIGSDLMLEKRSWYRADELAKLVDFLVVGRAGGSDLQDVSMPAVSSTDVRDRIFRGLPVDSLVPRRVLQVLLESKLYQARQEP